jgi:hypothetical protein
MPGPRHGFQTAPHSTAKAGTAVGIWLPLPTRRPSLAHVRAQPRGVARSHPPATLEYSLGGRAHVCVCGGGGDVVGVGMHIEGRQEWWYTCDP